MTTATQVSHPVDPSSRSATAQRILRCAARLFSDKGFAATTTRDIANAVGIRQPGLYKHFASKDAILIALYQLAFSYPNEVGRVLHRHPARAAARLHRWLYETVVHLSRDTMVLASILTTPELADPRFTPHRFESDFGQRFCERFIELGIREGSFLDRPAAAQAWFTLSLVDSTSIPRGCPAGTDDLLAFAFDALLRDRRTYPAIADESARIDLGIRSPLLDDAS